MVESEVISGGSPLIVQDVHNTDCDFSPLNTVAVDPQGKGYASGGEDGYVRVHQFDKGYFDFTYEVERQARQNL